jgi:hypothetical protein
VYFCQFFPSTTHSTIRNKFQNDVLPIELLHMVFTYFLAHEILDTFSDISDYVNASLLSYLAYRLDLQSIHKSHFDLVCRRICPEQVVFLKLSDDDNTPGLSHNFRPSKDNKVGFVIISNLLQLKIKECSMDELKTAFLHAPLFKSIDICLKNGELTNFYQS